MADFKVKITKPSTIEEETDKPSLDKVMVLLEQLGLKGLGNLNTLETFGGTFSNIDLSGLSKETQVCMEVKERNISHSDFGDVLCDKAKLDKFLTDEEYKRFEIFRVCMLYNDGYLAFGNPHLGYDIEYHKKMPKTTRFGNKGTEYQDVIHMNQDRLYKWNGQNFERVSSEEEKKYHKPRKYKLCSK